MVVESEERQPSQPKESSQRRALVILNPVAGQSAPDEVRRVLDEVFAAAGWAFRLCETSKNVSYADLVAEAELEGYDVVIAAGGDGTVALVANQLVGSRMPLAIIPIGTGNMLSRELGIPLDLPGAAAVVVGEHRIFDLDAMRIGTRHFFLNAGVGLPAAVMRDTNRESKRRFGMLAYASTAAHKLLQPRRTRIRLVVDGQRRTVRAGFVMVANAGTIGLPQVRWTADTLADDGVLEVIVSRARSLGDYLVLVWYLWTGRSLASTPFSVYKASRQVSVTASRPLPVQADGEVIGEGTLELRMVPRAVKVVVPLKQSEGRKVDSSGRDSTSRDSPSNEAPRQATGIRRILGSLLGPVGAIDSSTYLALSRLPHPRSLNLAMRMLSAAMSKGMAWAVGLSVASRLDPKRGGEALRQVLPAMWLAGLTVEIPFKRIFYRDRPFAANILAAVVGNRPNGYSFPSSHTAVAFAAAWLLRSYYPRWSPAIYGLAGVVGFSRLYLGVHYLSDVFVGAVSGTVLAEVYRRLLKAASRLV